VAEVDDATIHVLIASGAKGVITGLFGRSQV
jgi:hypothetical protein